MALVTNNTPQAIIMFGEGSEYTLVPYDAVKQEVPDEHAAQYCDSPGGDALISKGQVIIILGDGPGEAAPIKTEHAQFMKLKAMDAKALVAGMKDLNEVEALFQLEGLKPTVEKALQERMTELVG
jgi:hypothetical protein